ncbi:hypothetical protein C8J56DRAFT_1061363 [Mycena floridula]|nr:hypothetical protein C8J56DRAFT_1061363 [Mycena floridula]
MACQKKTDTTSNPPKKSGSANTTSPHPSRRDNDSSSTNAKAAPCVNWKKDCSRALVRFNGGCDSVKGEGLVKKVAKTPKNAVYALIAKAVFTVDADSAIQEDYTVNPAKHRSTVNNSFIQLRKQYREANAKIGCTGAGLEYFQVREGSDIWNIIHKSL